MKKSWKILSLLLIFLLMGCASRQSAEEVFPVPTEAAGEPSKSADSGTTLVSSEAQGETTERLVVKRAEMRVSVADPAEAMRTVVQWAESMQGYVVNSNQWNSTSDGQTYINASVMVRVPAERLDEMMQKVRDLAADPKTGVLSETVTGEDVTAEYVDSQARLRNLKAAEAQLVELLDQAPDLEYTLDIFRELTEIRSQIEVLEGRIKYLEESAALSALVHEAQNNPPEVAAFGGKTLYGEELRPVADGSTQQLIWSAGLNSRPEKISGKKINVFLTHCLTRSKEKIKFQGLIFWSPPPCRAVECPWVLGLAIGETNLNIFSMKSPPSGG